MKFPEDNKLLDEILAGDQLAELRTKSLQHALIQMRRQRRIRRTVGFVAAFCLLGALAVVCLQQPKNSRLAVNHIPAPSAPSRALAPAPVKTISDEELFALFPGRAVALIGPPGRQEFVLLDGPGPRAVKSR